MFLCRCSLFAEQELWPGKTFWHDRLSQAFGLIPHTTFAGEHIDWKRLWEERSSSAKRIRRLQVSLLCSSFTSPASYVSKEEYFLPSLETCQSSTFPLPRKGKTSLPVLFSTASLKTTLSTVHCFALTHLGFPPWEVKFSLGAGGEPQSPWYLKHTVFLSQLLGNTQGNSAANITGIYKHEEKFNRKLQTVARLVLPLTLLSVKHWWSMSLAPSSALPQLLQYIFKLGCPSYTLTMEPT